MMAVNNPSTSSLPPVTGSALQWMATWIVILSIVALLAKTSWGRPIVYYVTWLAVLLLVLGHASDFANLISGTQVQSTGG